MNILITVASSLSKSSVFTHTVFSLHSDVKATFSNSSALKSFSEKLHFRDGHCLDEIPNEEKSESSVLNYSGVGHRLAQLQ